MSVLSSFLTETHGQTVPYKRSTVIREIKYNIKDADYAKAIDNVRKAFEQHADNTRLDAEYYYYNLVAYNNLALAEAKKMYLQDKPDTAKYFNYVYSVFQNGLTCDSLANKPNAKGRVDNRYRKEIKSIFSQNEPKLSAAAKYFFQKKDFSKAYDFSDLYISVRDTADAEVRTVSALSVLSAYSQGYYAKAIKHSEAALYESNRREHLLEIVCKCHEQLRDTANFQSKLEEGVAWYPTNKYFYASLITLFNSQNKFRNALEVINDVLQTDSANRDMWFVKGTEEMHLGERDRALDSFLKAVQYKVDDAESYSNIGNIYLYKSNLLYDKEKGMKGKELKAIRTERNETCGKAKDAFENVRKYAEERPELWLVGLKEVYYKLNMGKELQLLERKYGKASAK